MFWLRSLIVFLALCLPSHAAVTEALLLAAGSNTDANSYATASMTPTAGVLVLATITNTITAAAADPPTTPTMTGNSLTWVQVATTYVQDGVPNNFRITVFRAMGVATTGAATIDFGGVTQTGAQWVISEYAGTVTTGANGADAIIQSATNTATNNATLTIPLAAFGSASNATYGGFFNNVATTITAGTDFVITGGLTGSAINRATAAEWRADNDTSVDATNANAATEWAGVAIEIGAAATARTRSLLGVGQ